MNKEAKAKQGIEGAHSYRISNEVRSSREAGILIILPLRVPSFKNIHFYTTRILSPKTSPSETQAHTINLRINQLRPLQ